ncbi:odorant receptor 191 [Tribolium castaneum]|uniref:Odorant receptor n=1 Tax=Tribolium castaneum TaxID=7070 RepID=D6X4Y2_TRICA|nr:odorant receptor 191 [Tribolium castaneum]
MRLEIEALKNFPYYYLLKICIDFGYSKIVKCINVVCIIINSSTLFIQVYYVQQHFNKELIFKYGCGMALTIYTIASISVEFLIEKNAKNLVNDATAFVWPVDFCGEKVKKLILKRATVMNKICYFMSAWFALMGIIMLPVWGDHSEWLLCDLLSKEYFETRWKILYFACSCFSFPVVAFSSIRIPGILLCTILQTHMQIILINQKLNQISEQMGNLNNIKLVDDKCYQKRIFEDLRLCVSHHGKIKKWLNKFLKLVQSIMPLYIILGCLNFISLLFFASDGLQNASNILKARLCVVLIVCCLVLSMFAEAGQALSDETSGVFDTLLTCPWYLWDKNNKKVLSIFLSNSFQPDSISVAGITLNYDFAVALLKTSSSYALVLYNMKN